jgi:O-acetyl-ADP-ribose deacetylase (regulator of RNase III)
MEIISRNFTTSTGRTNKISLVRGDIAQVPAQAMIAPINAGGMWFGAIDGVIQRNAGGQFHNQVCLPKQHLDTIVARKKTPHRAMFQDVLFVIDELQGPLHEVIYAALEAAGKAGYATVSLPAIRTGVMLGVVEKDARQAVAELLFGITEYFKDNPNSSVSDLIFVIYDSQEVYNLLKTTPLKGITEK